MTAEQLIEELDDCYGPCGRLCLSCPEARYLKEIRAVVVGLMDERDALKQQLEKIQNCGK